MILFLCNHSNTYVKSLEVAGDRFEEKMDEAFYEYAVKGKHSIALVKEHLERTATQRTLKLTVSAKSARQMKKEKHLETIQRLMYEYNSRIYRKLLDLENKIPLEEEKELKNLLQRAKQIPKPPTNPPPRPRRNKRPSNSDAMQNVPKEGNLTNQPIKDGDFRLPVEAPQVQK